MKVCFFARVWDPALLHKMSFYADDMRILRELGHEVVEVTEARRIPFDCDFYFIWWYGWGALPLLAAKLLRRPNVVVGGVHYDDKKYGYFALPGYYRWVMRWTLRNADAVLPVSAIELEGVRKLGARNPQLVYHGMSVPETIPEPDTRSNLVFSIGHMNRLLSIDRKGFDNVVRAIPMVAKSVPDVQFVLAGTLGGEFNLDKLAESLGVGDRVIFPGQIDNETRTKYLKQARVLAQPSEYEGFGMAQLEAMVNGVPVVTSPAGAVPEVVGDSGLYVDKQSPEDIAEKIVQLLQDADLWRRLSEAGRERARERFSYENRRRRIEEVLQLVSNRYGRFEAAPSRA